MEAERDSDIDGHPKPPQKRKRKSKRKEKAAESDEDDDNFVASSSGDDASSSEDDCVEITNEEVCLFLINHSSWILHIMYPVQLADSLPSKTVPSNVHRQQSASAKAKGKRPAKKWKSQPAEPSQVPQVVSHIQAKEKVTLGHSLKLYFLADRELQVGQGGGKRNPIYLFYEQVDVNQDGKVGEEGDKHYKCYHGNRKTLTITKQMKTSLNGMFDIDIFHIFEIIWQTGQGLIGHLKTSFPHMYQLYLVMKGNNTPPTLDEIMYALGKKPFDSSIHANYIQRLDAQVAGIKEAFAKQQAKFAVGHKFY